MPRRIRQRQYDLILYQLVDVELRARLYPLVFLVVEPARSGLNAACDENLAADPQRRIELTKAALAPQMQHPAHFERQHRPAPGIVPSLHYEIDQPEVIVEAVRKPRQAGYLQAAAQRLSGPS